MCNTRLLVFVIYVFLFLSGCENTNVSNASGSDTPGGNSKACFVFTSKIYSTVSPSLPGYPKTEFQTVEECNITENDARTKASSYPFKDQIKINSGTHRITVTVTTTYRKK
jgi:hypothetical protein